MSQPKSVDFKEVFKWVTSPLFAEKLGVPANMDSDFNINCVFSDKQPESEFNEDALNILAQQELPTQKLYVSKKHKKW